MKVSVYKLEKGGMAVLVQGSPGSGQAPVMIPNITVENLEAKVGPVVAAMRRQQPLQLPLVP